LLAAANAAGGRDNITVILLRLEEVGTPGPPGGDQDTVLSALPVIDSDPGAAVTQRPRPVIPQASPTDQSPAPEQRAQTNQIRPRLPATSPLPTGRRRRRRIGVSLTILVGLTVVAAGAYLALQSIYFIATNQRGLVTIYSGLPYTLPGKLNLYTQYYVSGVPASDVPASRRRTILNHEPRSETNAAKLVRGLELGQVSG
jgi:protein phosphatase